MNNLFFRNLASIIDTANIPNVSYCVNFVYFNVCLDIPVEIEKIYELRQQIGEGSTSKVFLAIRRHDGFAFACKVIDKRGIAQELQGEAIISQLRMEIETLQMLKHPNIIHYHVRDSKPLLSTVERQLAKFCWQAMVETSGKIYCIMENLEGGELYEHLFLHGPMAPEPAAQMLHGVFSAVAHMHEWYLPHLVGIIIVVLLGSSNNELSMSP
jgi:serine/threonine protein kinase